MRLLIVLFVANGLATVLAKLNGDREQLVSDDLEQLLDPIEIADYWHHGYNDPGAHYIHCIEDLEALGVNISSYPKDVIEDAFLSVPQLIRKYGYTPEVHTVQTKDGYILEMHRIVGEPSWPVPRKKQPVFLMHGILSSSSSWIVAGPDNGLAYLLSDLGYDVWMGNARGNRYSRKHVSLNPDGSRSERRRFWDFSWHEIGVIDVPELIDYILDVTKFEKLHYIGHSQGTTAFFVMASELPEYNDKILSMQALAPVAFMKNLRSPLLRVAALFLNTLNTATSVIGMYEFLPSREFEEVGSGLCIKEDDMTELICSNILFLIFGFNKDQMNSTLIPVFIGHMPAGSATNQIAHYGQEIRSGRFRQYDHGFVGNIRRYGRRNPPDYNLKNIRAPIALHYGANDWLADPVDVYRLHKELPNVIGLYDIDHPKFNHLDFLMAIDVKVLLYNRIFNILRTMEQGEFETNL